MAVSSVIQGFFMGETLKARSDGAGFTADVSGLRDENCRGLHRLVLVISQKYVDTATQFE